jgi:nitrogen fixation NifU-like protein
MKINKLYRELILKHYKEPFNKGLLKKKGNFLISNSHNILCNENIKIQIFFEKDQILEIRYETEGCAILVSSASLMSFFLKTINLQFSIEKIKNFLKMLNKQKFQNEQINKELYIFRDVSKFPSKLVCASLPWELSLSIIQKYLSKKK